MQLDQSVAVISGDMCHIKRLCNIDEKVRFPQLGQSFRTTAAAFQQNEGGIVNPHIRLHNIPWEKN